jgi:hypothetical protein
MAAAARLQREINRAFRSRQLVLQADAFKVCILPRAALRRRRAALRGPRWGVPSPAPLSTTAPSVVQLLMKDPVAEDLEANLDDWVRSRSWARRCASCCLTSGLGGQVDKVKESLSGRTSVVTAEDVRGVRALRLTPH